MDTPSFKNVIVCKDAKSPYWIAQYTGPDGLRKRKSTKVPIIGGLYQGERLTPPMAKRRALLLAHRIAAENAEEHLQADNRTVRELFDEMLHGKLGRVSIATYNNARTDYAQFCRWLGTRANQPIRHITRADIKAWIHHRRGEVRHKTVRKALTAINAAFRWAVDAEILPKNPCTGLSVPPDTRDERILHEAFTVEEIHLLIAKLPTEWASAVRCCLGTYGQRLGDILHLRWEQFHWQEQQIHLITRKTGRELHLPMQPWFRQWAHTRHTEALRQGGDAAIWVHPTLRRHTNPSPEFTQLVRLHGIGISATPQQGHRRRWHSKTFHSLRSTIATLLQAAGVAQGIAMQLVGHESSAVHSVYIRPSQDQLRSAAAKLPQF